MSLLSFRGLVPNLWGGEAEPQDDAVIVDSRKIIAIHAGRPYRPPFVPSPALPEAAPIETCEIVLDGAADTVAVLESRETVMFRWYDARGDELKAAGLLNLWPRRASFTEAFPELHARLFSGLGSEKLKAIQARACIDCKAPAGAPCVGVGHGNIHAARL